MASPAYIGATDSLPDGIESAPYFKITKVAEWSLQGFLTATGRDERSFLSEILDLSKFKPVPLDVRLFARALYNFYNGTFGKEVTAIAKDQAQSSINRTIFRGKEQLIVQRRYKEDLEHDLNRGVGSTTQPKRTKPASRLQNILNNKNNPSNPFVDEENSSIPSTWTLSSRLKGNGTASGSEKKLDIADRNIQSPELFVDTEDGESDEIVQNGSNTNDDAYSENHTTANDKDTYKGTPDREQYSLLRTPTKQAVDLGAYEFREASLAHFKMLNQDTEWVYEGMDMVKEFYEFRSRNCQSFSFARDWIADLTPGSQFEQALPSHIKPVANLVELSTLNVNERWPSLAPVFDRVFTSNSYDEVRFAIFKEDLTDPVVFYLISIVVSYSHYFAFHSELPQDLNEREAFIGFTWSFIRGALTLTNIETRSLEVLITGVEERKNQNLDLRLDVKQTGQFADGVGFSGSNQVYLAEASTLHQPKAEKLKEDEYKLVRAMRDSWISQLRATCRESIPCRAMTVFGSCSYKDETKLWQLDFKGVFRLFQFDTFLIPLKKQDFGRKMKTAALSCIELAVRVEKELQKRESEAVPVSYRERVDLNEAIRGIQTTTPTPEKPRKRKFSM
ncbi:hypothetical protein EC968_005947 [Mortierella alpina]|nr:hypothetical protein EC968_005947 [Mortierella alpina]